MHVAICIVGFRNIDDIKDCLSAISRSTYSDFQVVICENGGSKAFRELGAQLPDACAGGQAIRLVAPPENLGYAGGINFCIENSRDADAWWVLNPDAMPEPSALEAMVFELASGRLDMVGSVILDERNRVNSYGGRWRAWLARAESIGIGSDPGSPGSRAEIERDLSYISGCSLLVGRRYLATVGPMREDYFLYCEEVEWGLRGLERGMKLGLAPAARVVHKLGTTTGSGARITDRGKLPIYLDERNKILVTRDRFGARLPVAAMGALLLIFLRYGPHLAWRQLGYALEGWAAGLRNQRGVPPALLPKEQV